MINRTIELSNIVFNIEFIPEKAPALIKLTLSSEEGIQRALNNLSDILVNVDKSNIEEYNRGASWCLVSIKEDK